MKVTLIGKKCLLLGRIEIVLFVIVFIIKSGVSRFYMNRSIIIVCCTAVVTEPVLQSRLAEITRYWVQLEKFIGFKKLGADNG